MKWRPAHLSAPVKVVAPVKAVALVPSVGVVATVVRLPKVAAVAAIVKVVAKANAVVHASGAANPTPSPLRIGSSFPPRAQRLSCPVRSDFPAPCAATHGRELQR